MLANGEPLPPIGGTDLDGAAVDVADLTDGSWSVVLFFRGHW